MTTMIGTRAGLVLGRVDTIAYHDGTAQICGTKIQNDGVSYLLPGYAYGLRHDAGAWHVTGGPLDPSHTYRLLTLMGDPALSLPVGGMRLVLDPTTTYTLVPVGDSFDLHLI